MTFDRLTIGLVFVVAAVLACFSPAQGDTWWHLRMGLDIWTSHRVPVGDTYSYTATGAFFSDHGWLSDALFYALYRAGGLPLVEAGTAAAILAAWLMAWRLAKGSFEATLVCLIGGIAASTVSWAIRPQVFSMAALMVVCTLLVARRYWPIPVVFLLWANLHSAVILGLVALAGALAAETIERRRVPVMLVCITLISSATTFMTPVGLRFWPDIVASLQRSKADALIEWRMPGFEGVMWPFWAAVVVLPAAVVIARRRLHGRALILSCVALVLLPLAVRSVRNVAMFVLVATPAIPALLAVEPTRRRASAPRERRGLNAAILSLAAAAGALVVGAAWRTNAPALDWQPLSAAVIAAIEHCPDPIYNTYEGGGALIWFLPGRKVFIDNRQDPYPPDLLHAAHDVETTGRYKELFQRYGIRCAVVPAGGATSRALARDAEWTRSGGDAALRVFVRP